MCSKLRKIFEQSLKLSYLFIKQPNKVVETSFEQIMYQSECLSLLLFAVTAIGEQVKYFFCYVYTLLSFMYSL